MPNLGLLGISMHDERFFEAATEGSDISIDFDEQALDVSGKQFQFELSQMEKELHDHGGISSAFQYFGRNLFHIMTSSKYSRNGSKEGLQPEPRPELQW